MDQDRNRSEIELIELDPDDKSNAQDNRVTDIDNIDIPSGSNANPAPPIYKTGKRSNLIKIASLKRRIKKYDKYIDALQNKIDELGNMEIGCDDDAVDDDKIFVYLGRLEEKLLKLRKSRNNVVKLVGNLTSEKNASAEMDLKPELYDRPIEKLIRFSGSGYICVDKALTNFVNKWKKKSVSNENESLNFREKFYQLPSYDDILRLIRKENSVNKLNLNTSDILALSQDVGGKLYNLLKKYTTAERKQALIDMIPKDIPRDDPAVGNSSLENDLIENEKIGSIESKKLAKEEVIDSESKDFVEWMSSTGEASPTSEKCGILHPLDCSLVSITSQIAETGKDDSTAVVDEAPLQTHDFDEQDYIEIIDISDD